MLQLTHKRGKSVRTFFQTQNPHATIKTECKVANCKKQTDLNQGLCKGHYQRRIDTLIKREIKVAYKYPEQAFASLDFQGMGYIVAEQFRSNLVVKRLRLNDEDLDSWLEKNISGQLTFLQFKRLFFPNLFLIEEVKDTSTTSPRDGKINLTQYRTELITRMKELDQNLKHKFQSNWVSVRKAFLDLDFDHDGFINAEDILRFFGPSAKNIDFNDLKLLLQQKCNSGSLDYCDFSKWIGGVIQQSEGFFFRHDSVRNPVYEENKIKQKEKLVEIKSILDYSDIERMVFDKMRLQWTTLKKAFTDLCQSKKGFITQDRLKQYLHNWGISMDDQQFACLFEKMDLDKDGQLSYEDFQNSVGKEIHPREQFYFRQDMRAKPISVICQVQNCHQTPSIGNKYCQMHKKIMHNRAVKLVNWLRERLGIKWPQLSYRLRRRAEKDEAHEVPLAWLTSLLQKQYDITLTSLQQLTLKYGLSQNDQSLIEYIQNIIGFCSQYCCKISIQTFLEVKENDQVKSIVRSIDFESLLLKDDDFNDKQGFVGNQFRTKYYSKHLLPITQQDFLDVVRSSPLQMAQVMKHIRDIDGDNNGYVTNQELEDIIKLVFPQQLSDRDLKRVFRPFASIQNTILIDYRRFKSFIDGETQQLSNRLRQRPSTSMNTRNANSLNRSMRISIDSMQGFTQGLVSSTRNPTSAAHIRNMSQKFVDGLKESCLIESDSVKKSPAASNFLLSPQTILVSRNIVRNARYQSVTKPKDESEIILTVDSQKTVPTKSIEQEVKRVLLYRTQREKSMK